MLQLINDRMKVFGWIIILPLALVFVVWGVQGIVSFNSTRDKGLQVDGQEIPTERIREAYQGQLAQLNRIYPDEIPADIRTDLQQRIVDQFVNTELVRAKTDSLRYVATDADLIASISNFQGFQVGGKFDREAYESVLRSKGYTIERFEAEQRDLLKTRSLEQGIFISAFATPLELTHLVALKDETREVGYAVLPLAKFLPAAKADDAAINAYYAAHKASYMTPDSVHLTYVALKVEDVAKSVTVDEAALRAYYDTVKDRFVEPEKRRARHILIQTGTDGAAAKKKAEEIYAEAIKPGADFAALAKKYSMDAGSAQSGGDLGWAERTFFVPEFAEAAFSMKPGEIRGPIKTEFGWHVIKLDEIQPGVSRKFEDVKADLEPEYRRVEAEKRFGEEQEKIEQVAFEKNDSLEPVAKELGLKIEDVPVFYKGLAGNELAASAKVVQAAFSADVLGGQNSKAIEVSPGTVVVLRSTDHKLPTQQPLEAVRATVTEAVKHEAAVAAAQAAANTVAKAVENGTAWDTALRPIGAVAPPPPAPAADAKTPPKPVKPSSPDVIVLTPAKFIGRSEAGVAPEVLTVSFGAATPAAGARTVGTVSLANGDVAVYAVSAVKPGVLTGDGAADRRLIEGATADSDFATYLTALKARATIHYNPAIFE